MIQSGVVKQQICTTGKHPKITETHAWLARMDVAEGNRDEIRRDIANRITALMASGKMEPSPRGPACSRAPIGLKIAD